MGEMVSRTIDGQELHGYFAESGSSSPGVIVIQEWWGLVGHIKDIVDRFAKVGFNAFAPDLYHGQSAAEPDLAKKLAMELQLDSAANEINSAAKFLKFKGSGGVGVVGFCMGGTLSIWGATLTSDIKAAVAFYPGTSWARHNPKWEKLKGKSVIIHCSEGDGTSKAPGIQEALVNINSFGGDAVAFDYPGTEHAFFNNDRSAVYKAEAAELAWNRTIEFFGKHL